MTEHAARRTSFEVLACEPTPLGLLVLRRRELLSQPGVIVTEVTLDGEFLMSSYLTASERALATSALDLHPGDALSVLVGGLGLGYTAQAALADPRVARVEVVELLPEVIRWVDAGLLPLSDALRSEPRLRIVEGDVYARLLEPAGASTYDVVVLDVDHSPDEPLGPTSAAFYTRAGLARASQHLTPGGVLGVWSYAEHSAFRGELEATFADVRAVPITVVNDLVDEEQTDWLFLARAPR